MLRLRRAVLFVFDPAVNLVRAWGGPGAGYEWPESNHGVHIDVQREVWIGGNGAKYAQTDLAFSKDPQQRFIFLADGTNEKVRIISRDTMQELTNFGDGGRQPGQFYGVAQYRHRLERRHLHDRDVLKVRLQKFLYKGMANVAASQGAVWPRGR